MALKEGPTRAGLAALANAEEYVGTVEQPAGSNRGPMIDRWNTAAGVALGSPYCATFGHMMFKQAGVNIGADVANADSYCPTVYQWGKLHGLVRDRPWKGYVVLFDWDSDGVLDHFGIVRKVLAIRWRRGRFVGLIQTVEANTSAGLTGSQSNGDGVYRRLRWMNGSQRFLRVPGPKEQ